MLGPGLGTAGDGTTPLRCCPTQVCVLQVGGRATGKHWVVASVIYFFDFSSEQGIRGFSAIRRDRKPTCPHLVTRTHAGTPSAFCPLQLLYSSREMSWLRQRGDVFLLLAGGDNHVGFPRPLRLKPCQHAGPLGPQGPCS